MMKRAACVAMALCLVSAAQAQTVRYKQFANPGNEKDAIFNKVYLAGVRDALQTVNGSFVAQGGPPLFCMPPSLALTEEQAEDIVRRIAAMATRNIDDMSTTYLSANPQMGILTPGKITLTQVTESQGSSDVATLHQTTGTCGKA